MVGILVAALLAALTFALCTTLDVPMLLGIIFAVVVLAGSISTLGGRFGMRNY
jgi:hypothetical protein